MNLTIIKLNLSFVKNELIDSLNLEII